MKKVFKTIALCLTLPFALSFVACGHTHTYSEDWSTNATHHWHKATCDHTDETSSYGEHVYDNESDTVCNTCSYERETATYNIWDGTAADVPAEETGVITISTAEELAGLAASVNEGTNYAGKTIKLACDINLKNIEWTPIGNGGTITNTANSFRGNFDGQNHTIYNLTVNGNQYLGLFGIVTGDNSNLSNVTSIKNLNIENTTITGNYSAGALAGHIINHYTTVVIENVNVSNVKVTVIPELIENEYDNGDKVGGIIGYIEGAEVKNCSVKDVSLKAYRDVGGLVGCVVAREDKKSTVTGTYENVAITVDQVTNHYEDKAANCSASVGRNLGENTVTVTGTNYTETINLNN